MWFLKTCLAAFCSISWAFSAFANESSYKNETGDTPAKKLNIIASIPPLGIIAREIAGEVADIKILIQGAASPHDYALTIGQALSLQDADLLLWVGPDFEQFLQDKKLPAKNLSMSSAIHIEGHINASEERTVETHSDHDHHHHGDFHLWLNDHYVEVFASALTRELIAARPGHANILKKSLAAFLESTRSAIVENQKVLNEISTRSFVAHHDGYTQLLSRYALTQSAALTRVPHERISAKRLGTIEKSAKGAACLLAEADEAEEAKRYARILDLPLVEIDILASKHRFDTFADFERSLGQSLLRCFRQE